MAAEQDLELDGEAPPPKKSKLMLIIIIVVVLAAAGAAAFFFLMGGEEEEAPKEGETAEATQEGEAAAEGKGEAAVEDSAPPANAPAQYVKLKPEFVISFQVGPRQRFLQVYMEVMTRDDRVVEALELHSPMIRSSIVALISDQDFNDLRTAEGRVALRDAVTEEVKRLVKQESQLDGVERVLFTNFVMQ